MEREEESKAGWGVEPCLANRRGLLALFYFLISGLSAARRGFLRLGLHQQKASLPVCDVSSVTIADFSLTERFMDSCGNAGMNNDNSLHM